MILRRTYINRSDPLRKLIILLVIFLFICFNYSVLFLNEESIRRVAFEDGIIENSGALYFFISSILCFVLFGLNREGNDLLLIKTNKNIFYLFFGIAFLFASGEEISWGQRIFGLAVPQAWTAVNVQKELTIHNLIYFQKKQETFFYFTNINTWFTAFSLGFCFFIPLLNKLSKKVSTFLQQIGLPVVRLEIGIFFLMTYVIFITVKFYFWGYQVIPKAASEIKESIWAFLYLVIAISWIKKEKSPYCKL